MILLGDEAIAQGAIDAGLSGIYAYPGTPSTEITEYVQSSKEANDAGVHSQWTSNEKTALEAALGMSYAGKRAMACMKHVGLNVAADPFINSAMTGVNGGLIIAVADDPSMHSSQNEQDSRFYGKFARVPILEPASQQEAYDMIEYAFDISEKSRVPVLLRITTRLAHSRAVVETKGSPKPQNDLHLPQDLKQFILLPSIARKKYELLLDNQEVFEQYSSVSPYNELIINDAELGIICCGLAYNYFMEVENELGKPYNLLKICQYPVPEEKVHTLASKCKEILVIEEGYPFVEENLRGFFNPGKPVKIKGRMDGSLPRSGELNPGIVASSLGIVKKQYFKVPDVVEPRPPALCKGCSHADMYFALNEALAYYSKGRTFSDIGCYTLGALPPYNSINSCVDMGASITMAKGAADAGLLPSVAVIGDSTFTHSGMTGLLDAVNENSPITLIISDNSTTGMTGGQQSSATGRIETICLGLGVEREHLHTISPLKRDHDTNVEIIKQELEYQGVSVIIAQRECIQTAARRKKLASVMEES